MRLVFAGTPEPAVPTLRALVAAGHEIVAVVTREDAPVGRKRVLTPSPVAVAAHELGLPIIRANRLDDGVTDAVAALEPELGVIVAYGGLVRRRLLDVPAHGWINLHFSRLPAWRGAAPVQRAIMAGDREIGAAVFQLVEALDAGDVFASLTEPVAGRTAGELLATLAESGAGLTASVVASIAEGSAVAVPQEGEPTVAAKLDARDGVVDWARPAASVLALVRGVTPEPGASTSLDEQRIKLLAVEALSATEATDAFDVLEPGALALVGGRALVGTADEPVRLVTVQPAGKKPMDAAAWLRGLGDLAARRLA